MNLEAILQEAKRKAMQHPNEALVLAKEGLEVAKKQDNFNMLALAYYVIAIANSKLGKYKETINWVKKSLEIIYLHNITGGIQIGTHTLLASSLISIDNKEAATKEINIALKIATETNNQEQLYRSLVVQAHIHERYGQYYTALQIYKKVKNIQAKLPTDYSNLAISSSNIANIFNRLEQYNIALDYYKEALRYLETIDVPRQKLILKYNICVNMLKRGAYNKSELEEKIKLSIIDSQKQHFKHLEVYAIACLSKFYLDNNIFIKSEKYAQEGLLKCKNFLIEDTRTHITFYNILFNKNWKTQSFDTAIYYGELILDSWKENHQQLDDVCLMIEKLLILYQKKGANEKGLQLAIRLSELKKKTVNHKENFTIDKLRSEMEVEQKRREIAHIKTLNDIEKVNNAKLKNINKELESFVGIASHDLKAPLRSIIGFSKILKTKANTKSVQEQEYLDLIIQSGQHMNKLLDNLLSYAKAGKYQEKTKNIDLNDVLTLVKTNLNALITEKKAIIQVEKMPIIQAHFSAMTQVFQNLVNNALIYAHKNIAPIIHIKSEIRDNTYYIFIKDNGKGIDNQKIDSIFEPFVRGNNENIANGTGLGLATCKKIITYYHGDISVKSTLHEGSTFILTFPKQKSKKGNIPQNNTCHLQEK